MISKKKLIFIFIIFLIISGIIVFFQEIIKKQTNKQSLFSPLIKQKKEEEKPLSKYEFDRLKDREPAVGSIVLERELSRNENFTSYIFSFQSEGKKISGLANIPAGSGNFPVLVMLRGWVDPAAYQSGVGTQKAGEVLAKNGFLTLSPDFLGYGESDKPPDNVWEERLIKNINLQDLFASIASLDQTDGEKIGIWAHSNGGLSALTFLALSAKNYPTALWAPVSQYFPYDVLFYTFEAEDKGKALRKSLAEFEQEYDAEKYSFDNYLERIKAPVQIHQGLQDPYIPIAWSDELVSRLKKTGLEVNYYKYDIAGHNMEGVWDLVMQRDLQFFKGKLK